MYFGICVFSKFLPSNTIVVCKISIPFASICKLHPICLKLKLNSSMFNVINSIEFELHTMYFDSIQWILIQFKILNLIRFESNSKWCIELVNLNFTKDMWALLVDVHVYQQIGIGKLNLFLHWCMDIVLVVGKVSWVHSS